MNTSLDANPIHVDTDAVGQALRQAGASVQCLGANRWQADYCGLHLHAQLAGTWLCLTGHRLSNPDTPIEGSAANFQRLLAWNGLLPGGVRFGLDMHGQIVLHAEVLWTDEWNPVPALALTCDGIATAGRWLLEPEPSLASATADAETVGPIPEPLEPVSLKVACLEAGWDAEESNSGCLKVILETGRTQPPAELTAGSHQGFLAQVPLIDVTALSDLCRDALAVRLLRGASLWRLARPVLIQTEGLWSSRLEVRVDHPWPPSLLHHALSSLSVALDQVADDLSALIQVSIAKEYMSLWELEHKQTNQKE
jgi:hypothetical protein